MHESKDTGIIGRTLALPASIPYRIGHPPTLRACTNCGRMDPCAGWFWQSPIRLCEACDIARCREMEEAERRRPDFWADFVAYPSGELVEVLGHAWFDGPEQIEFTRDSGQRSYAAALY